MATYNKVKEKTATAITTALVVGTATITAISATNSNAIVNSVYTTNTAKTTKGQFSIDPGFSRIPSGSNEYSTISKDYEGMLRQTEKTMLGVVFQNDTTSIIADTKATSQGYALSTKSLVSGRTETGWNYELGLEYTNKEFEVVWKIQDAKGATVKYERLDFKCSTNDSISLALKIDEHSVVASAKDLSDGTVKPQTFSYVANGTTFKGYDEDMQSQTFVGTEMSSIGDVSIAQQTYSITSSSNPVRLISKKLTVIEKGPISTNVAMPRESDSSRWIKNGSATGVGIRTGNDNANVTWNPAEPNSFTVKGSVPWKDEYEKMKKEQKNQ